MFVTAANTTKPIALWGLSAIVLGVACANAFAQDAYSIRVEPLQVIVPAFVFLKDRMTTLSRKEQECSLANAEAFYKLRLSEPYTPTDCDQTEIRDLTAKDFRLFEDGVEQKVQDVTLQRVAIVNARDNAGWHTEYSHTPRAKWSSTELGPLLVPGDTGYRDSAGWHPGFYSVPAEKWSSTYTGLHFIPGDAGYFYRVAYAPPQSEDGSCHQVRVDVDRSNAFVFARSQYCKTRNAPSDPLAGTELGEQLQGYSASGRKSRIHLSLQTAVVHQDANSARVDIAIKFPWDSLARRWKNGKLDAMIGVLGMVYTQDGALVTRFSDLGCCARDRPNYLRGEKRGGAAPDLDASLIPTRYETQINLPPGEYKLRLVLTDERKFGLANTLLTVEPYGGSGLGITSVVLCDRFREAHAAAQEDGVAIVAPLYVPLVSKGAQFAPAGDTRIHKGERLFAYFEVQDPLVLDGSTKVCMRLKVLKLPSGKVKADTGFRELSSWVRPGSPIIPVAQEIAVDKLPSGSYRLEVQVSDSAGRIGPWRAATFAVE